MSLTKQEKHNQARATVKVTPCASEDVSLEQRRKSQGSKRMAESPREQEGPPSDPGTVGNRVRLRKGSRVGVRGEQGEREGGRKGREVQSEVEGQWENQAESLITICILSATKPS